MLVAGVVLILAVAGAAYAAIPDGAGVYTACRLNNVGTIRLIDPSGPSTSLLSHCTSFETKITWNQQGPAGAPGKDGANGTSPTVAQLSPGDSHCAAGGAAITDAAGTTAYVCSGQNGQNGKDGQPFAGTFTSPNGQFSLSVTDGGVEITGPDAKVSLPSSGGVTVASNGTVLIAGNLLETVANDETTTVHHDRTETVDSNETITVHGNRTETVDKDETITVHGNRTETVDKNESIKVTTDRAETVGGNESVRVGANRTEKVDGNLGLQASAQLNVDGGGPVRINGAQVAINGGTGCNPAARVGDAVDPVPNLIITGSPTVCIG